MSFSIFGLSDEIIRAVTECGYIDPTPIQLQAIPAVLAGGDLLAGAQTGTGKTARLYLAYPASLVATRASKGHPADGRQYVR